MATIKGHGGEVGRIEKLTYDVLFCSDGTVLRNSGDGWRNWRKLRVALLAGDTCKKHQELYEEKLARLPEFASWRALVHGFPLRNRALLVDAVSLLSNDADGLWAELEDRHLPCTVEEAQALAAAYLAAVKEANAGTHPTIPLDDPV